MKTVSGLVLAVSLFELKHYDLGIGSQPQRRSPGSCAAGSENLHLPDPT